MTEGKQPIAVWIAIVTLLGLVFALAGELRSVGDRLTKLESVPHPSEAVK